MAVPSSGPLSLAKIRQELETANYNAGPYTAAATNLDTAENGSYEVINTCSPAYPLAVNSARMSEWYGYDHDALCAFALNTDTGSNMLRRSQNDWGNQISTTNPGTTGTWMLNFWIKHINTSNYQGYIMNLSYNSSGYPGMFSIYWDSYYDANDDKYLARMNMTCYESANTASVAQVNSQVILNDDANYDVTEIEPSAHWNSNNPGDTAQSGYKMITIHYNYNNVGTDNMIQWYWNGNQLTVPYGSSAYNRSYTQDGGVSANNFGDNGQLIIGGIYPYEIGSGLYVDEVTIDPFDDNAGVASTLWNSGTPLNSGSLATNLGSNILHYDFNNTGSLGTDVAKNYSHNLSNYNSPGFTTDSAD